jgi:alpha-glucosidase
MLRKIGKMPVWSIVIITLILSILIFGWSSSASADDCDKSWKVSSPDNTVTVTIQNNTGTLSYNVTKNGKTIIDESQLGITTKDGNSISDFKKTPKVIFNYINESYSLPGRKKTIYNNANEITLEFPYQQLQHKIQLTVRVYNDGMSYRYCIVGDNKNDSFTIKEVGSFSLPAEVNGYWLADEKSQYTYRPCYVKEKVKCYFPILLKYNNGYYALLSETEVGIYGASYISPNGWSLMINRGQSTQNSDKGSTITPWRVVIIGDDLAQIVESTLIENLNHPSEIQDTSWIKPGRAVWFRNDKEENTPTPTSTPINGNNSPTSTPTPTNTPPVTTHNKFIDLAASMNWEYYLADNWEDSKINDLAKYAGSKNVGILLRTSFLDVIDTNNNINESKMKEWAKSGVKGIRIDLGDQNYTDQQYNQLMNTAAEYHLLVDFNGYSKNTGDGHLWPHWSAEQSSSDPKMSYILPYIRNGMGPLDYPIVYPATPSSNHSKVTLAYQTALGVIFQSNIQFFYVSEEMFNGSSVKEFLKTCPTSWDDTKLIGGEPGKYVIIARKKGDEWYVGAISGEEGPRTVSISLSSFLESGDYIAKIYKDGASKNEVVFEQKNVTKDSLSLKIPMLENGGCAIQIIPRIKDGYNINVFVRHKLEDVFIASKLKNAQDQADREAVIDELQLDRKELNEQHIELPWHNQAREKTPFLKRDDEIHIQFTANGSIVKVKDTQIKTIKFIVNDNYKDPFVWEYNEKDADLWEIVYSLHNLKDVPPNTRVTLKVRYDDENVHLERTDERNFFLWEKYTSYGQNGLWMPISIFSSNFEKSDKGLVFAPMPISVAFGRKRNYTDGTFIGNSLFAALVWYNDSSENNDKDIYLSKMSLGCLRDHNGYFYYGLAYIYDFQKATDKLGRETDNKSGLAVVIGVGPKLLEYLNGERKNNQ